jgi:hypothetical protein
VCGVFVVCVWVCVVGVCVSVCVLCDVCVCVCVCVCGRPVKIFCHGICTLAYVRSRCARFNSNLSWFSRTYLLAAYHQVFLDP